jgi:tRNA G18 (ribose-2'-O)-methylase SpoU
MLISIDNPSDSRLHAYRDIRERDMVGREGRFVAEGKVVISVLLNARRFETESILVSENRLAGISALLEAAPATLPVYVASEDVLSQIAGFHVHRGVLAIGKARPQPALDSFINALGPDALVVVLSDISNHDNVGSMKPAAIRSIASRCAYPSVRR